MQANIDFDLESFDRQFKEISKSSSRSISEQNRLNTIMYLREMVYATRKRTGSLRAGFLNAWFDLQQNGTASSQRRPGETFIRRNKGNKNLYRTYKIRSSFRDNNKDFNPSYTIINNTSVTASHGRWKGKEYFYVSEILSGPRATAKLGQGLEKKIESLTKKRFYSDLRKAQRRVRS